MNLPEPQSVTFTSLFAEIENGTIKIPQFQRDFVWSKTKSAKLLDSIVKGYPIGTFILWKTNERLRSIRNLGRVDLPETPEGDAVKYVLDGQQRLTSLFVTLKGLTIQRAEHPEDFSQFWVDLAANESQEIVLMDLEDRDPNTAIQLKDLLSGDFAYLASFARPLQEKIRIYKNRIEAYQFSTILMKDAAIDVATEVFTRLNVGGEPLSVFEIMVAKTYDTEKQFDLAEKFSALVDELKTVDYDTLSSATVLQTVSVLLCKDCRKKVILNLSRSDVIATWSPAVKALHAAVDYFRGYYRIPVSKLLPYAGLVIPFAYFFYKHPDKPDANQKTRLEDFFWRISLAGRYSQSLETRIFQDIQRIDKVLAGEDPDYDWAVDTSATFIQNNGYFSVSRSYIKSLLCILAFHQPKSFEDNSIVHLDNAWLKQANSKNYHHFFPKAWLAQHGELDGRANHIANITLVDDYLNKRVIRAKPPGDYIPVFQKKNADLAQCLADHLIELNEQFGVLQNDYARFFNARCEALSAELKKRITPREIDSKVPAHAAEDTVEEEPEWEAT
jgi:hypothetical protein